MNSDKKLAGYKAVTRFRLSFIFLSFLLASCGNSTSFFNLTVKYEVNNPAMERPTGTVTLFDVLRLNIYLDNFLLNETSPVIRVEGLVGGASLKLMEGSCQGEVVSSLDRNGVFEGLGTFEDYTEIQYYVELSYQGKKECKALEKSWVHLLSSTLSLNEEQTALDKRKPQFNAANLFSGKEVELGLYETPDCSGESLSSLVNSSSGDGLIGVKNPIGDLNNHTYYVKQSYKDVSTCSLVGVDYAYSLELENISLSYDDVILGGSEGVVEVSKVLPGSTVSLHKESCNSEADDTLTEDGTLTPTTTNTYTDVPLYVKYTYDQTSVCSEIGSRYVYLEKANLALNQAQTSSHKRTPTFDVTNLYPGKNVEVALYESAACSGTAVSETVNSDTGSSVVSISSELNDNNTHTYYLKQSYAGVFSCSEGVQYTYGLDIEDLTITSDPILYGTSPSSIRVTGMIPGSSVSIHKGSCEAQADDSITADGTLTPVATNTYTETDIYLKYSLNQGSSCQSIGVSYLNLVAPVLALNSAQTNQDKRAPKFDVTNLFTGKNVAATLHESSDCSGGAVGAVVNSNTGSALMSLSSALSDTVTHTYSVKQSYQGYTSCSNSLNYQYSIDTANLTVSASSILYGVSPGSVTVSKMLSGSTVSLHKGSCNAVADASISSDGTLTPVSTGSYNYSELYIKYTKGVESDCDSISSHYLYLEQPTLSLNSTQTASHPLTPSFNVANLFVGQSVAAQLFENSSCSGDPVSASSSSSTGSTTLTLSSALTDSNTHSYYVKQTYQDHSTCSATGVEYAFSADTSDLTLTYSPLLYGTTPTSITVSGMVEGSSVTLHKGDDCSSEADATITSDGTITPLATNTYAESDIYLKYSFDESSSCTKLNTSYIYLETPSVSLNSSQTALHKRTPSFNVGNLFTGKTVTVALYENSSCSGDAVSESTSTNSGSTTLTLSSDIIDNDTHTYYVKQSYSGVTTCSSGIEYTYGLDISDLTITSDPILYGASPSSITVSGMIPGSSLSLLKGSCNAPADETISSDGTLTPTPVNSYIETDLYLKYSLNQGSSCQSIGVTYLNLVAPVLALNSAQTNLDKRAPKFDVSNLFTGKNVAVTIHENSNCSGGTVGATVNSSTGSALMSLSSALTDINSHTYSVKQSYQGHTSCSNSLVYQYSIDTTNLGIVADEILYGATPGSVTISKMLSGSTVSLHKGSCGAVADASITEDGTLTPTSTGSYNHTQLYIKYTKAESTDCDPIDSYYLYLEQPTLSLNSSQTDLHPLTPTFNVTNLYSGKSVTAQLFENSTCTGEPVSASSSSSTGSTTLTLSSALTDSDTHSYYVKQSYQGFSSCSSGFVYSFSADTSDLSLTYAPVLYGTNPTGVTVSGMVEGSTVSLYKGNNCNGVADATRSSDGTLTPLAANSYMESDVYLKYSFDESSSCTKLDTSYIYLQTPTIVLGTLVADARRPSFDVTGLFNGKSVTTTLHESLDCSGAAVSTSVVSSTGSSTVTKTSALTDLNSHPYSVKQSYGGVTSCSNSLSYQYSVDVDNLSISADTTLYGGSPGSVTVSNMLSGSTVTLHKGSCNTDSEASRSSDGALTPLVPNPAAYQEVDLYIKYTFNATSDCKAVGSKYLYLKSPTLALNSASTASDPRTPIFDVTDLYSGKTKTITLYNGANCTGSIVKAATSTTLGATTISPSSALTSTDLYNYSVAQTYEGYTTCSNAVAYQYSIDTSNLVIVADELLYGTTPGSVTVSHMLSGSTVSLHKGSCNASADASINADGTLTPSSTGSYNYSELYIKYTKGGSTDCDPLDSYYLYLEQPTLALNSSQTDLHPLTPTFNVTNLFSGKSVSIQLFENSSCTGGAVSESSSSSSGSTSLTLSSAISDGLVHTYYVKQSYLGRSTCSAGVNYSLPVDTQDLTITTSIYNGVLNASVSGGYVGSTVSLHKGECNAATSDSASFTAVDQELDLSVTANSYTYQDIYLKYTIGDSNDCVLLDKKLTYLASPTLALVSPLSDKRVPEFNITGLYSGKTVTVQVYESSNCTGSTVTTSSTTNTGSKSLTKSTALADISSHTYSAKQTFNGISSCSNSVSYTYPLNVDSLTVSASSILYGSTPGSVSVSGMLAGSTVSLHKGSCGASADTSISSDGTLTPTSTGSYTEQTLYLKYSYSSSNNCKAISSKYLYLEDPVIALDDVETSEHKDTPTFNVTNLFSGKEVTVTLHESSSCSDSAVSSSVVSSTGSASVTLSAALESAGTYEYYVKQSYSGYSTCSSAVEYEYNPRSIEYVSSIPEYNRSKYYGMDQSRGIVIKGTKFGNRIKVYEGDNCTNEEKLLASVVSTYDTTLVHLFDIKDGIHRFSFKELDSESNVLGCYSTGNVKYKTPSIYRNFGAFSHLVDGAVTTYGNSSYGGDSSSVASSLTSGVVSIFSTQQAFAALKEDGSVVTWGTSYCGGNSSSVASSLTSGVVSIFSTYRAFAALKEDGSVVTWGASSYGGDSSSVASSLTSGVVSIFSIEYGFAALKEDGSVVTWGTSSYGGDSSSVASKLASGVVSIFSTGFAVAALKEDGSVVTWGDSSYGGDSSSVASKLASGVVSIFSAPRAFAALKEDGSVVTWGYSSDGGNSSSVASKLASGVVSIFSTAQAFAALKEDGSVVTWGSNLGGGSSSLTSGVVSIFSTSVAFAALKEDGSVVTWGDSTYGGNSNSVASKLASGVVSIFSVNYAFAALKEDGSVVTWGASAKGGDQGDAARFLDGGISVIDIVGSNDSFMALRADGSVVIWGSYSYTPPPLKIFSTNVAFTALKEDGSVVTWGDSSKGGNSSLVASSLTSGVVSIFSNPYTFAALKEDGSVVTWGESSYGGDSSSVASSLTSGVVSIFSTKYAFAALKEDGSVVTWGNSNFGGNSSSVASSLTSGVVSIFSTERAFAALKEDGSVVTWGYSSYGGDSSGVDFSF